MSSKIQIYFKSNLYIEQISLCQETGLPVVFIEAGVQVTIVSLEDNPDTALYDAINAGITTSTNSPSIRASITSSPVVVCK